MKAWMMRSGLYRLVKGLEKRPSPADKAAVTDVEQAAMDKWDEKALKAAGELFLAIEVEQRTHLAGIEDDPVAIWTKLESVHLQQRPGARFNAYDDLFNIRKKEDESLVALGTRINEVMLRIKNLRPPSFDLTSLDDELVCMTMLRALPEEYHHLSTSLQLADKLDKSTLLQAFITEDINQKRRVESGSSPVASALSAVAAATVCAFCSLPGHSIESCYRQCKQGGSGKASEASGRRSKAVSEGQCCPGATPGLYFDSGGPGIRWKCKSRSLLSLCTSGHRC